MELEGMAWAILRTRWAKTAMGTLFALTVLVFYPEQMIGWLVEASQTRAEWMAHRLVEAVLPTTPDIGG
ncbi:hypothetical protein [Ornithinimicrobium avium]|uniref:Uncharacterized protein n=1 Tax=Ornithinimicrobium avium TaxID=2283195 RepID=A0A345NPJ1_9MICO|nr:hypothetical protein [Ornithinimicrobium avium]AXH96949.1 hypothetical protein DV701_13210 [Ornithinimicrobium avium]